MKAHFITPRNSQVLSKVPLSHRETGVKGTLDRRELEKEIQWAPNREQRKISTRIQSLEGGQKAKT